MSNRVPKFSIILAGGKGTRMGSDALHKVTFPIDGRPAINRSLELYSRCGIRHHIVVVGHLADQVMETISREHSGILYAFQAEQLGTAHAARQGAFLLEALGAEEDVFVVAGDRILDAPVLERLFHLYYSRGCDLAFLAEPRRRHADLGRVLLNADGTVMANVEFKDVCQRRIYRLLMKAVETGKMPEAGEIVEMIRPDFSEKQAERAFGPLWTALAAGQGRLIPEKIRDLIPPDKTGFEFLDRSGRPCSLSPDEVEAKAIYNASVYLVRSSCLRYALERLNRDNAQQEEYLPDMITLLAQARENDSFRFQVNALIVEDPHQIMAFNDPAELLEIEAVVQARKSVLPEPEPGPDFRSLREWKKLFREPPAEQAREELQTLYGESPELRQERCRAFLSLLEYAGRFFKEEERVFLIRSPGRVNLMGRHVDHQGGHCNLMTIGYETLLLVRPRRDDRVTMRNADIEHFPQREFSIGELVADLPWEDWISLVNSDKVSSLVLAAGGDWSQYIKAAALRLQKKFTTTRLRGMDLVVQGNVPIAAGLSSSSALVVGAAEAMTAVNCLETIPSQFVNLCGEGEWFVGTRGGAADHAAIKYGRLNHVVKVTFFPFQVEKIVPFPKAYLLLVCDSGIKARKTANARDQFNHRVACYRIGFRLIRRLFPQYASLLHHLRDLNIRTLGIPLGWIYRILLHLPEQATRESLKEMLPGEDLEGLFNTHAPPADGLYPIRGVVLYGLAECERSRLFSSALEEERIEEIGRLMRASHDGDRVSRPAPGGEMRPYTSPSSNACLLGLMEDLESGDPERVMRAQLQWQPGGYHCSIPEIDRMVDLSTGVEGVVGAQLAGAGLGGCMMVLARREALEGLTRTLTDKYYLPEGKSPSILRCEPIAGSGALFRRTTAGA